MGQKIKELRKAKKLTQQKLAKKLGVSQGSIATWEQDKFDPNLLSCVSMADFFGVSLDELCCRGCVNESQNLQQST